LERRGAATSAQVPVAEVAAWDAAAKQLRQAGLFTRATAIEEARQRGLSPDTVIRLACFYRKHKAAFFSPQAIRLAIQQLRPGDDPEDWASWPEPRQEYRTAARVQSRRHDEERAAEQERQRAADTARRFEELEAEWGDVIDRLNDDQINNLLALTGIQRSLHRRLGHGRGSSLRIKFLQTIAVHRGTKPK
jgi:hypothetical protein